MRQIGYRLFDADNHYYESRDCFSRYIEPRHRDRAIRGVVGDDGQERVMVGGKPFTFLGKFDFEHNAPPGALREMLRSMNAPNETGQVVQPNEAAFREPPSQISGRHGFVSPGYEEDLQALVSEVGVSQVVFGSDYPHPEGLAEPLDFVENIETLSDAEIRLIMRDNARGLVGLA
jgi:hypothetical protein